MTRRSVGIAIVCASLVLAGCSGSSRPRAAGPESTAAAARAQATLIANRFTVRLAPAAVKAATAAGVDLRGDVDDALERINALLPGPATTISVTFSRNGLISGLGVNGYTAPLTGEVSVWFGPSTSINMRQTLTMWLPQALSHEVNHSVRIIAGPTFGVVLRDQIVSEGLASAFDAVAVPGSPDPWDHALTRRQECQWWTKVQPLLDQTGLYDDWMFGQHGIPHWTGFDLGYQLVHAYRQHHPATSWKSLTNTSAATILTASQYHPCENHTG